MTVQNIGLQSLRQSVETVLGPAVVRILRSAYASARDLVASADLDPLLMPMALGMNRYLLVQNSLLGLPDLLAKSGAQLESNANNSWYHIELGFQGILVTVESVAHWRARPRPAQYRSMLARQQLRFEVRNGTLVAETPESLPDSYRYLHILHGRSEDRESLGFVLGVFEINDQEYDPVPLWLYSNEDQVPDQDDLNIVQGDLNIVDDVFPFS